MKFLIFLVLAMPAMALAQPSLNMTLIGTYDDPELPTRNTIEYSDCWGFTHANGTEIAIIGGIEDILFIDITIPANPVLIYSHHVLNLPTGTVNKSAWRDFMTFGNYVYAAADEGTSGLLIFDMSQVPNSITMVTQTTSYFTKTHTIFIDGLNARLYAGGSNTVNNGLVILDLLPDPTAPSLEANVPLNAVGGGYVHDMYVRDNIAYCSHGSLSKIQMYDFSMLPSFTVVGAIENYPETGYNHSSWINDDGTKLVMCDETHASDVKLVDITDPENISSDDFFTFYSELLGPSAPGSSIAHNPFIMGDLAFIAYYHDGVQVFDISNPNDIEIVAYYDTYPQNTGYVGYEGCWGVYPFFPSGMIIASDMNNGLFVLEMGNPPLDIDFVSFEAYRQQAAIQLEWSVADAAEGNRFDVNRSLDGGVTFESIGKVTLTEGQSKYTFTDTRVAEATKYVYRIDFEQWDGSRISSPLRVVRTAPGNRTFRVTNPFSSSLTIDLLQPSEQLDLSLFNLEGELVWSQKETLPGSRLAYTMEDMPAGHYVLTLNTNGVSENLILQKVR
jgi:choice-of-anchor B domain-containing protein